MLVSAISCAIALLSSIPTAFAHTVITYPGWRGDNLHANGTVEDTRGLATVNNGEYWPYGMQWSYPCGGMRISQNRTKWPISGGAFAFQPGWFQGHSSAFIYINMGYGTAPPNLSNPILNGIELLGPTNNPYPGTWCFPQLSLPVNASVQVGDNATLQLIETAKHGAALYNCVDITFAADGDPEIAEVNSTNCFNSTQLNYDLVFTTTNLQKSDALRSYSNMSWLAAVFALGMGCFLI